MWPPNYTEEFIRRQEIIKKLSKSPSLIYGAKEYYKHEPKEFINDFCITYDPRNSQTELPTAMPFNTFERQDELISFIYGCVQDQENGLVEKTRDMGASWTCGAISVHMWLFYDSAAIGWGSRKEELVDRHGDMKALFPKMRMIIEHLPSFFYPKGFDPDKHMPFMNIKNTETGASITGESGDNIGRGGRTLIYFKDEAAYYERPEKVEAALADNTNVQIDISSVNGVGNVFHRRREAGEVWAKNKIIPKGKTRVFIMDWRDHPLKTQEWYNIRKKKADEEGLSHVFAQEVDRDYAASIQNTIIKLDWVRAAIDAHKKIKFDETGMKISALDVADEGEDKNAWGYRKGLVLKHIESWAGLDTTETAQKAIDLTNEYEVDSMEYDSIGVGAGVKGETNRLKKTGEIKEGLEINPWGGSDGVINPDHPVNPQDPKSKKNKDFFENLKAQAYWNLSTRLFKTYRAVTKGENYPDDELISIDSTMDNLYELEKELCQPQRKTSAKGKMMIDKKPPGTKSPNLADCVAMMYTPNKKSSFFYA